MASFAILAGTANKVSLFIVITTGKRQAVSLFITIALFLIKHDAASFVNQTVKTSAFGDHSTNSLTEVAKNIKFFIEKCRGKSKILYNP